MIEGGNGLLQAVDSDMHMDAVHMGANEQAFMLAQIQTYTIIVNKCLK